MPKTKKTVNIELQIESIAEEIFAKMGITAQVKISHVVPAVQGKDKEKQTDHYLVEIQTEESGLLIGHHGETINSLQLILGVILYRKLGQWVRVVLDVGNYRKMREETIREMVNRIINEVEQTGQSVELPFLSPLERRTVHLMLSGHKTATSQSNGEGRNRKISIMPKGV